MSAVREWTWPWLIAVTVARGLLAALVMLALWGALPAAIGWKPTTVSSGSMLPRLEVGDIAVSRPVGKQLPGLGSVVLFPDPDHPGRLRLHRFVAVDDQGRLITRGDANPDNDSTPVEPGTLIGIGTLRIPWVGLPIVWLRERTLLPLGLTLLGVAGLVALVAYGRRFGFAEDEPPVPEASSPAGSTSAGSDAPDVRGRGTS